MFLANGLWRKQSVFGAEIETSALLAAIVGLTKPELCIESGSAWGDTAEAIGKTLKANGRGWLHTADPDPEKVEHCRKRLAGLPVIVHECEGKDMIQLFPEIDFAFIDSWWNPVRTEELLLIPDRIKPNGFLALHDVCQNYGLSYDTFADRYGWPNLVFHAPYGVAVWQKPGDESWRYRNGGGGKMVELTELPPDELRQEHGGNDDCPDK